MCDTEVCRGVLEQALEMEIEQVIIDKEKSIIYNPEYKGVRLDIIAKDEQRTRYNIEMQIRSKPALGKRTRYYHSQIEDAVPRRSVPASGRWQSYDYPEYPWRE